jgi:5-methylthioadenosine/S-adenosylhomocysteine deaminase
VSRFVLVGGTVIPMTGRREVYPNGLVAVDGDRIRFAGDGADAPDLIGYTQVDVTGRIVIPGIVNTHCHAAMTLLRGYADDMRLMEWLQTKIWPVENERISPHPDAIYWGTALAAYEMLSGGITTFLDMYFRGELICNAIADTGIRGVVARGIIGVEGREGAAKRLSETRDLFRQYSGKADGRITFMVGPHAPYTCPPDTLQACLELAEELDVGIHIHLSETYEEVEASLEQWGKTPIRHIHDLGLTKRKVVAAHCVHPSEEDIDILADHRVGVCHCPVSNLKLASGVTPVMAMRRAGVQVGLGTDGAASENLLHILGSELRIAALLAKNLEGDPRACSAYDALEMATIGGARALGMAESIGSLEKGKLADIAVIRTDRPHLVPVHDPVALVAYSVLPGDVERTYVNGREVYRDGRLLSADGEEIMRKAAERAREAISR